MPPPSAVPPQARLATPQHSQRPASPASPGMSRAERFEEEKRRIIDSCFSKLDEKGQLAESYITHIRIQEDAQHPSGPPPPDSNPDNKKHRLIIIAVKASGRVRMHKARENNNGSFSIGKTWNLEDMSAIETYGNPAAPIDNERTALHRQWAGSTGFTVTITKPYYWQAGTSKEKDFFIASAVKIFRKYTKGQIPDLRGFDDKEKAMVLQQIPPPANARRPSEGRPPPTPTTQTSFASSMSRDEMRPPPTPGQAPSSMLTSGREEARARPGPGAPGVTPSNDMVSRQLTESPGRLNQGLPPPPPSSLRPGVSSENMRGPGREAYRTDPRPGTAQSQSSGMLPPAENSSQVHLPSPQYLRTDSPNASPTPPARHMAQSAAAAAVAAAPASLRPLSPPKMREHSPRIDAVAAGRQRAPSAPMAQENDGIDFDRPPLSARLPPQPRPTPLQAGPALQHPQPQAYRPPPTVGVNGLQPPSGTQTPRSFVSESPSGTDLGDAATLGAITSYWNAEPATATASPPPPRLDDASTVPATPERSKRRPQVERKASESTLDLRPAPLNQVKKTPPPATTDNLPNPPDESRPVATPPQQPSEIKPLSVPVKSETAPAPSTASVVAAPVQTPPVSSPEQTTTTSPTETSPTDAYEEQFRPGLGPMYKKRAIADRFKKAANAANAFKPRPGGAAAAILNARNDGEPDGINGVVPRPNARNPPSRQGSLAPSEIAAAAATTTALETAVNVDTHADGPPPAVEVTSPTSPAPANATPAFASINGVQLSEDGSLLQTPDQEIPEPQLEQRQTRQPQVKMKRRSFQQEKYLAALEIDRSLLEGRGLEFEMLLSDFGWNNNVLQPRQLTELENDVRREQGRVEAGSWLSHTDAAREERVTNVENLLDKAIAECDELEGLLTLYHVELNSLNDDIAFIEAQSQGLQVQSANQKLLQSELQNLVSIMSLDRRVMETLRRGDLSTPSGVEDIERHLTRLYDAMLAMNPSLSSGTHARPRSRGGLRDNEIGSMVALREKRHVYDRESADFCQRLTQYLDSQFTSSIQAVKGRIMRVPPSGGLPKLQADVFAEVRSGLWMYSPLLLFTKQLHPPVWQNLMRNYSSRAKNLYVDAFRSNVSNWKDAARQPNKDEAELLLFTSQEKEESHNTGALSTARKITVKRSQTLAKTLRHAAGDRQHSTPEYRQPGAIIPAAAFAGAMNEMAPLLSREQNFVVDLFHATSLEQIEFLDAVQAVPPHQRLGTNLLERKPVEPDREIASRVKESMEEVFSPFATDMSGLLAWAVSVDPLQGVGVLANLSRHAFYLQDSCQEYLLSQVETLSTRLQARFAKFVDEQVRAIEDTKVKIKKRKGVIAFMKVFPHFSAAVENIFLNVAGKDYDGPAECVRDVRRLIDDAYERINTAMFDSLKVIAKESPVVAGPGQPAQQLMPPASGAARPLASDDPEDKQMLNYHILLIENMNHYIEEVDDGGRDGGPLADWRERAQLERADALDEYVSRVVRRPLGKILDFLESAESILATQPVRNPGALSQRPSYSRKQIRQLLAAHDSKEIRRGIDVLRRRIDKHFSAGGPDDDPNSNAAAPVASVSSRALVASVCRECEARYDAVRERLVGLVKEAYPNVEGEKSVEVEFARGDVAAGFRR